MEPWPSKCRQNSIEYWSVLDLRAGGVMRVLVVASIRKVTGIMPTAQPRLKSPFFVTNPVEQDIKLAVPTVSEAFCGS